jgi:hypothetical protein
MMASGGYSSTKTVTAVEGYGPAAETDSVLIPLNKDSMPDDTRVMDGFDILIVSNFDTDMLSAKQMSVMEKWVENGGTLIVGTGVNWEKTYGALPENLKKFTVTGVSSDATPSAIAEFAGKQITGNVNMEMVSGDIGFKYIPKEEPEKTEEAGSKQDEKDGNTRQITYSPHIDEVIAGNGDNPLIVKYIHQQGRILLLMFDPGMEPLFHGRGSRISGRTLCFIRQQTLTVSIRRIRGIII